MIDVNSLLPILQCPQCFANMLSFDTDSRELLCSVCGNRYPIVHGRPVLLRIDNVVFFRNDYRHFSPYPNVESVVSPTRFIPNPSVNLARNRVLSHMKKVLSEAQTSTVLIVGGGRQRKYLDMKFGLANNIQFIYTDIDVGADVDIFCDGHDLPFIDCVFDAVITTAVLEHVLYPERVVAEIYRVSKINGLLYSEMPFMQQVHEGAYDFTRYTLSGHRRLLNGFSEIESGIVAGPSTALVWAIENFVLAFLTRSLIRKLAKAMVRLSFGWMKHFDRLLVHRKEAMDGASCTYFFGSKIEGCIPDTEIIAGYVGAKHLRHTS